LPQSKQDLAKRYDRVKKNTISNNFNVDVPCENVNVLVWKVLSFREDMQIDLEDMI